MAAGGRGRLYPPAAAVAATPQQMATLELSNGLIAIQRLWWRERLHHFGAIKLGRTKCMEAINGVSEQVRVKLGTVGDQTPALSHRRCATVICRLDGFLSRHARQMDSVAQDLPCWVCVRRRARRGSKSDGAILFSGDLQHRRQHHAPRMQRYR